MREDLKPALAELAKKLSDAERTVSETKRMINTLCDISGVAHMYVDADEASRPIVTSMRTDQFYGKVMSTSAREYLEMRKAANLGPAQPREIYEALVEGGFKFDTKSELNALAGLRQTLRKNSSIFHRLPNGRYGLLVWYPNAKPARDDDDGDDDAGPAPSKRTKPSKMGGAKKTRATKPKEARGDTTSMTALVMDAVSQGGEWPLDRLKGFAKLRHPEIDGVSLGRKLHGATLGLRKQAVITKGPHGGWIAAKKEIAEPEAA
jgi:hypothetical protein